MLPSVNRSWYALHRWIGALVGLQLLAWSVGGFVFATQALDDVHGDRTRKAAEASPLDGRELLSPAEAARRAGVAGLTGARLRPLLSRVVYELEHAGGPTLVDAERGERVTIDAALAEAIARADQTSAQVAAVEPVADPPPIEYRGQPLPAWRVRFADAGHTHVYVGARSGAILARRNDAWRRFDFFWMLHTMDYRGRDDFNHPTVVVFAGLGIASVSSGFLLFGLRVARRVRRRRALARGGAPQRD